MTDKKKGKNKFGKYIQQGVVQPMSAIAFHGKTPIKRLLMLNKEIIEEAENHIAVHFIKNHKKHTYVTPHVHDCDEINLILSEDSELTYKICLEDEVYEVVSPATVFIPKGIRHSAEAVSGTGTFIVFLATGEYKASER